MNKSSIIASAYNKPKQRRIRRLKGIRKTLRDQILSKVETGVYAFEEAACPCCTEDDWDLISNYDRDYLPVRIVLCRNCGMMYQNLRLVQEALAEFYTEEYRELYNPGQQGNRDSYLADLLKSRHS